MSTSFRGRHSRRKWVPWSGIAALVGSVLWIAMPWLQLATLGTRPYVATGYDVGTFAGWVLMAAGLAGVLVRFGDRIDRIGRLGVGLLGVGTVVLAGLSLRRVLVFLEAGLRAVPATGEDPVGLILTWTVLIGLGFTLGGAGLLGTGLRRLAGTGLRRLGGTDPSWAASSSVPRSSSFSSPASEPDRSCRVHWRRSSSGRTSCWSRSQPAGSRSGTSCTSTGVSTNVDRSRTRFRTVRSRRPGPGGAPVITSPPHRAPEQLRAGGLAGPRSKHH